MMRSVINLIILVVLVLALVACQGISSPSQSPSMTKEAAPTISMATISIVPTQIIMTDGLERQVTMNRPAQKIVSLAASNTEILFAVGAGTQVVGRDNFSDYPEEAKELTEVGDATGYNHEVIVNLQPDLVLAAGLNSPEEVKALEDLGLTVYYLPNPKNLVDLYANLVMVGILTGHESESEELVRRLMQRVDAVEKTMVDVNVTPGVFYELDGTDPSKPWTSGPGTFIDKWISMAGGRNIGASLSGEWVQISQEEIIFKNPDIIVLGDSIYGVTPEIVATRPGWEAIKAVQDNKVYPFNDDLVSRPGPRLVDGLVELAKIIHPEIAAELK